MLPVVFEEFELVFFCLFVCFVFVFLGFFAVFFHFTVIANW